MNYIEEIRLRISADLNPGMEKGVHPLLFREVSFLSHAFTSMVG